MSVLNPDYTDIYTAAGTTGPYPITFDVILDISGNAQDILVQVVDSAGVTTDITSTSTITGLNVYTAIAYDATNQVVLVRYPDVTQPYTFPFGTKFPSKTFENALDRLLYLIQRGSGDADLALKAPFVEVATPPARLPTITERASKLLGFDGSGDPIAADGSSSAVSAAMAPVVSAATLAASKTAYGISAFIQALLDDADAATSILTLGMGHLSLTTGSPYSLAAWSYQKLLINATTNPYIVNLPQASTCVGFRVDIVNASAASTGLVEIVPYSGDAIGKLAANVKVYLQNVDQSGMAYLYQHLELIATVSGEWAVVSGQFCPAQAVDTNGQQYHLGKLHHLPIDSTARQICSAVAFPVLSGWSVARTGAGALGVPTGAKAILVDVLLQAYSTAAGQVTIAMAFDISNGGSPSGAEANPRLAHTGYASAAGQYPAIGAELILPLNASGQFYNTTLALTNCTAASSLMTITVKGFYMGD